MDFAKSPGAQDTVVVAVSIVFFIVRAEDRKKRRSKLTRLDCYYLEMLSRGPYSSFFRHYSHVRHNWTWFTPKIVIVHCVLLWKVKPLEEKNHWKKRRGFSEVPWKGFPWFPIFNQNWKPRTRIFEFWDLCRRLWPYQMARVWRSAPGTLQQSCHKLSESGFKKSILSRWSCTARLREINDKISHIRPTPFR